MNFDEKLKKIKTLNAEELLKAYLWYREHFNPMSDEHCDLTEALKTEIIKRMERQ